ncbi:MAG TPA: hypothetical protein VK787_12845 [Puia sp.]|jgi:hypothetical protein|nr:hypothetical protein [Puia sp.]
MKPTKTPTSFSFSGIIILFISILIFSGSCVKQTTPTNPDPTKPNPPTNPANSQIIYTDVNPDSVILDSTLLRHYDLDLNNDGIIDFVFTETVYPAPPCRNQPAGTKYAGGVKPAGGSNNAIMYELSMDIARPLDSLSVIDSNANWTTDSLNKLFYLVVNGPPAECNTREGAWFYGADKYLGLKFIKNDSTYYGWARLRDGVYAASLTLIDYAYNNTPNQQILAGQTK